MPKLGKERETQTDLLKEYFEKNPNRDIAHPEIVDWATVEWQKRTGEVFRDPDRGIRKLHQDGFLIKVKKGVYRYDPEMEEQKDLEDFSSKQKKQILERDKYKCVICGQGKKEGMEIHVDHIKPKDLGGKATIENGQTLCATHNFQKKNLKQTEAGKKMFIRLYELAQEEDDEKIRAFCADILKTYEKHNINGHIEWQQ